MSDTNINNDNNDIEIDLNKYIESCTTIPDLKECAMYGGILDLLQEMTVYIYSRKHMFDEKIIESFDRYVKAIKCKNITKIEKEMTFLLDNIDHLKCAYYLEFSELKEYTQFIRRIYFYGHMAQALAMSTPPRIY